MMTYKEMARGLSPEGSPANRSPVCCFHYNSTSREIAQDVNQVKLLEQLLRSKIMIARVRELILRWEV